MSTFSRPTFPVNFLFFLCSLLAIRDLKDPCNSALCIIIKSVVIREFMKEAAIMIRLKCHTLTEHYDDVTIIIVYIPD